MSQIKRSFVVKNYPYMHKFMHGAFSANSGGQYEDTGELECMGTPEEWNEAEQFLKNMVGAANSPEEGLRHILWWGMEADGGVTVTYMTDKDEHKPGMPWEILNRYY